MIAEILTGLTRDELTRELSRLKRRFKIIEELNVQLERENEVLRKLVEELRITNPSS